MLISAGTRRGRGKDESAREHHDTNDTRKDGFREVEEEAQQEIGHEQDESSGEQGRHLRSGARGSSNTRAGNGPIYNTRRQVSREGA